MEPCRDAPGTPFTLHPLGDVSNKTGAQLQTLSAAGGVTEFLRPEDGAWDPANPATGGTIDTLLDGAEPSRCWTTSSSSDILGEGWFLLDVQAHYAILGELVEGGQLLALHYPPGRK